MKIADMHCDTISRIYEDRKKGIESDLSKNSFHIDIEKLKKGNYVLQNFALYVNMQEVSDRKEDPLDVALEMARIFHEEIKKNASEISKVTTYEDILANEKAGKISAVLTVEEGGVLKGNLDNLQHLYKLGVRMLTLTWNYPNELGYPNLSMNAKGNPNPYEAQTKKGLTPLGIECVQEMQRMGMMVDVSHLSDRGFYDVAQYARKPFVASHSNARTMCPWVRNMTDEMIKVLAHHGGVMGLNLCPYFLTDTAIKDHAKGTIDAVVQHAKHIVKIGGIECLGIGTDFDGIHGHEELPDASHMWKLIDALSHAHFTASDIEKITTTNVLRVYKECL